MKSTKIIEQNQNNIHSKKKKHQKKHIKLIKKSAHEKTTFLTKLGLNEPNTKVKGGDQIPEVS